LNPTRLLFVCTGNICRSPTAEGVALSRARALGVAEHFVIDSAGTHNYHSGEPPDSRSTAHAARRGYDLTALRARQLRPDDYYRFDYLLAMDYGHLRLMQAMRPADGTAEVVLFTAESKRFRNQSIPDPYYGGEAGFEHVLDMIEEATDAWLRRLAPNPRTEKP
jgi:protein-tyrosine phosphatase